MNKSTLLILAAFALGSANADPLMPDDTISEPTALRFAHAEGERMHERWRVDFEIDWQRGRERMKELICGIGYVAGALIDCGWSGAAVPDVRDAPGALDLEDAYRRAMPTRMRSI